MSAAPNRATRRDRYSWRTLLGFGALFALTLMVYAPALSGTFLWDDDGHVTQPALQSSEGLWRIWFELGATQQYYPVLHSAFWIEHRLWGDAVLGYHLVNVLLHAGSACLLVVAVRRLLAMRGQNTEDRGRGTEDGTGGKSAIGNRQSAMVAWIAGGLFAIHPMAVESVAWITEQKNTLSLVFYLLAGIAYLRFAESDTDGPAARPYPQSAAGGAGAPVGLARRAGPFDKLRAGRRWYFVATGLFILALLTKSVTATLPGALLVVLWWRRGRIERRDGLALGSWLAIGAAAGLFTAWVERHYIGAQGELYELGAVERCLLAARATWFYLGKLAWPADLSFIYPRWDVPAVAPGWWPFLVAALALTFGLWWWSRRSRGPLAAWLFFVGSLFPALGFVNVYPFRFSYVADHFAYVAIAGGLVSVAAVVVELTRRWPRAAQAGAAGVLAVTLGTLSWRQSAKYRSSEALWRATVALNPKSWLAQNDLAQALLDQGRVDEAIVEFERARPLRPGDPEPENNLALALVAAGRFGEAIPLYQTALRLRPEYAEAWNNLGVALARMGRPAEAAVQMENALRLRPDDSKFRFNLALALETLGGEHLQAGRNGEAIAALERAIVLNPEKVGPRYNLGLGYVRERRWADAVQAFRSVARLAPDFSDGHLGLAFALEQAGASADEVRAARAAGERLRAAGK